MAIQVQVYVQDHKASLRLNGRFDFNSHREFRSGYEEVLKGQNVKEVEVDLGNVDYMDSSALGMLLSLKDKADVSGKKIILANCRGTVLQILKVANFETLFSMRGSS
ncbi:MAG: STAS domain-containing protein [Candidatus Manganitrophaceae bacterium]